MRLKKEKENAIYWKSGHFCPELIQDKKNKETWRMFEKIDKSGIKKIDTKKLEKLFIEQNNKILPKVLLNLLHSQGMINLHGSEVTELYANLLQKVKDFSPKKQLTKSESEELSELKRVIEKLQNKHRIMPNRTFRQLRGEREKVVYDYFKNIHPDISNNKIYRLLGELFYIFENYDPAKKQLSKTLNKITKNIQNRIEQLPPVT